MKKNRLIIIVLLIIVFSINISFGNSMLYKKAENKEISTGTELTHYRILTEDGWVTADVIALDLNDEYNKIGLLTNISGDRYLDSIKNMVVNNNAIAGINADFFAGRSGIGHAIGLAIDDYMIASSATNLNNEEDKYASFLLDEQNNPFFEYVSSDISIVFDGDIEIPVRDINKYSDDYSIASVFNENFGKFSIGSSDELPLTEIVVEDDKIVEIRELDGWCIIPENGYVISILNNSSKEFLDNIRVGSKVKLNINYRPNLKTIKFAVSGGAKLIENGVIPEEFSHNINGRNPRTAIGTNKKEDTVYLITIDGRIKTSIGMTQQEEAEFLQSIGIYNAINLDGGGSSTMVAKKLGDVEADEINTPSGGMERKVTNGVGIFNDAPNSTKLDKLVIEVRDTNIFKGEDRKVTVKGYNKYLKGVEIDLDEVKWDYDGVEVRVEDGYVIGDTPGETTLIAKIGKAKGEIKLNILDEVNEIYVYPKEKHIDPKEKIDYTIKSKDVNGNYAITMLNSYDLSIDRYYNDNVLQNYIPEDAYFKDMTFYAEKSGTYILKIQKENCITYAKVVVGSQNFVIVDDFEKKDFTFDPYPDEVGGDAVWSDVQAYEGKHSAKLTYDFDRDYKVRGAYIVFDEEKIIPTEAIRLAFWVYNDEAKDEQLKIKGIDANDQVKIIVVQDNIIHDGWAEVEVDLSPYALPLRITDIYLAQHDEDIRSEGFIYVDKFGYYSKQTVDNSNVKTPNSIKEETQSEVDITSENSFNIAIIDSIDDSNLMLNWLKNNLMVSSINKDIDLTIFTNNLSKNVKKKYLSRYESEEESENFDEEIEDSKRFVAVASKINTDYIENNGYECHVNNYCTMITMDISQNGIRKTDSAQYSRLSADIDEDNTGNIIIILNDSIDNFSDIDERFAFLDILKGKSDRKNIIVAHKGFYSDYSMEYGIRFLGVNAKNTEYTDISGHTLLKIAVNKNIMSYKYERILGRKSAE